MFYDTFMFNTELDVLEIRLNEMYDVVDKFILVEGEYTHQGKKKPLCFWENKNRFSQFKDKIIHINATSVLGQNNGSWTNEHNQRNALLKYSGYKDGDYITICDVDEILKKEVVQWFRTFNDGETKRLQLRAFYYYLNCFVTDCWTITVVPFQCFKDGGFSPHMFRRKHSRPGQIGNAGWHFSYMGGVEAIVKKFEDFAHAEYNTVYWKDKKKIEEKMSKGEHLFEKGSNFTFIAMDESYPKYVIENIRKYQVMGWIGGLQKPVERNDDSDVIRAEMIRC